MFLPPSCKIVLVYKQELISLSTVFSLKCPRDTFKCGVCGGEGEGVVQWNESSQAKSKGSSQCHKMNFSKILDMVGIFFGLEGCPKLLYCQAQLQLAS